MIHLAQTFPAQPIVLDHVGGPMRLGYYAQNADEEFQAWRTKIIELSRCENVSIKLGGLGMRLNGFGFDTRARAPSSDELVDAWKPYIDTCIAAFGPQRCMFESNFPVDKISGSYVNYWNAFKKLAAGASDDEKGNLFKGTAKRFYGL